MSFQDLESGGRAIGGGRLGINGRADPAQAVAAGVFQINTAVSTFQRLVNTLGTPKDTPELREKLHKTRLHIGQLVKDTSAKLKQTSETDHLSGVKLQASKKIADAKLAKDFQAVLKEFQKAQRLAAERETAYSPFVPQSVPSSNNVIEIDGWIRHLNSVHCWNQKVNDIDSHIENSLAATAQAKSAACKGSQDTEV
ncbi:hypothetical protein J5N97_029531 [Dioscorea zingiberensis]|uniref:Syntaxin N-terminal domain-containing protein n=1 Tax=Dioscorea zingiberensis TaxID=325984 RepID=A0A9D5C132_9LILI|nr:hypothetical protein J5N97_029531 [Dioscorea zingiberensis]